MYQWKFLENDMELYENGVPKVGKLHAWILLSARYSLDTLEKSEEVFSVLNLLLVFVIVVQFVVWHSFRTTH
jgi:hypothetical protein